MKALISRYNVVKGENKECELKEIPLIFLASGDDLLTHNELEQAD